MKGEPAAIVHSFTAGSSTLSIVLNGADNVTVPGIDRNPILNGLTLELLPSELDAWRSLQGLSADGSQDLANPSGDGVPDLLKYAFNLANNAGDLTLVRNAVLAAILAPTVR